MFRMRSCAGFASLEHEHPLLPHVQLPALKRRAGGVYIMRERRTRMYRLRLKILQFLRCNVHAGERFDSVQGDGLLPELRV